MLRDLDLAIEAGERVLLVGPSGSGKSTLLRALAGLLETADAGERTGSVTIDGAVAGEQPGAVGLVLQEPGAGVVASTVERDIAFGPENVGMPRAAMPELVTSALAQVGLDLPLSTPTDALSGGQTQRLALAGALALEPTVLLLDEPTAMLAAADAAVVRASVDAAVREQGLTLVVVEHVLGPWIDLVDRLIVLDASGVIVADGPVRETLAARHTQLVGMGVWVPGAGAPDPLPVDPALVGVPHLGPAHPRQSSEENTRSAVRPSRMFSSLDCLGATPLTVTRRTATVDGIVTERVAARLEEPLRLAPGELAALVGRSGSGKSTILHALAGFLVPAKGTVRVGDGEDPARLAPVELARRLAWIPQWASSTIVTGRVLDEVLLTSRQLGDDTPGLEDRARGLLETLGLGRLADADPRHLSGGEMRRLAIVSAILHGPDIVLADEPTVGQDRHTWAALVGLLAAYRAQGGAIVTATHDQAVIDRAHQVHHLDGQPREAPGTHGLPWLSGRNPLALLAGAALAVPAGVASPGWRASLVLLALQFVLAVAGLTSRRAGLFRPLRALAIRLLPGVLAALSVAWSTWLLGGRSLDLAATGFTRVLLIVLPSAVLLPFIDTDRLGDELAQRLRLPDRFVVAVAAALHRMQSFGDIWTEIARARKVRGIGISWRRTKSVVRHVIALTIGLLVRSLRSAAELAVAMDARGFATAHRRSWLRPVAWRVRDSVVVVASTLPLLLALLFRR